MKLKHILFEFREIIDRYGNYGQWIDTRTGDIHPVKDEFGHVKFLSQNHEELFKGANLDLNDVPNLYVAAYQNGFVRVTHPAHDREVAFTGHPETLKRALSIILPTAAQRDLDFVSIEPLQHPEDIDANYIETFDLSKQNANDVKKYIDSL